MNRFRGCVVAVGLMVGAGVWLGALQADDEAPAVASAVESASDPVADLVARIEKLEKRIAALEGRDQLARQVNANVLPAEPQRIETPPAGETRPGVKFWLLKQTAK